MDKLGTLEPKPQSVPLGNKHSGDGQHEPHLPGSALEVLTHALLSQVDPQAVASGEPEAAGPVVYGHRGGHGMAQLRLIAGLHRVSSSSAVP